MAYVGNQPALGQWRKLSDISSIFDGVITTFTTSVPPGTSEYFVTAGSASQLLVSLGGVIQQPDVDYTVSTNSITFTTAPAGGLSFFGVLCGDALNAGTPSDGSVTTSKLAGGLSVSLADGSAASPSLFISSAPNTGVFSPGADQLALTTSGVERVEFGTSEVVFNDGGANYDFRIEGDTNANLLFVDASTDRVGIGTSAPVSSCHIQGAEGSAQLTISNTNLAASDGDFVAGIDFLIKDNDDATGAVCTSIRSIADQNHSLANKGTALAFSTTPDDTTTLTERLRIDQAGRVGIGSTSVASNFKVEIQDSGATGINIRNTNDSTNDTRRIAFSQGSGGLTSSNTVADIFGLTTGTGPLTGEIYFRTNSGNSLTERLRIDSSGRLLLGTSTSSGVDAFFQVVGNHCAQFHKGANDTSPSTLTFSKSRNTTYGSFAIVQNEDRLGSISFRGDDGIDYSTRAAEIVAYVDGTPGANDMPGRLVFSTTADGASSPTERMRIESSGNIRIASEHLRFDTSGKGIIFGIDGGSNRPSIVGNYTSSSDNNIVFSVTGSERMRISNDGTISTTAGATPSASTFGTAVGRANNPGLIESYRNGSATITVANIGGPLGNALIKCDGDLENTNNRYTGVSDIKFKENIVDAASQWVDIKSFRICNYNYKAETGYNTHTQLGLIAQEVELISPGLVGETLNEDTGELTKNVAYSVLYMKAVKALQEAMERIETLEAKVAALEAQ